MHAEVLDDDGVIGDDVASLRRIGFEIEEHLITGPVPYVLEPTLPDHRPSEAHCAEYGSLRVGGSTGEHSFETRRVEEWVVGQDPGEIEAGQGEITALDGLLHAA